MNKWLLKFSFYRGLSLEGADSNMFGLGCFLKNLFVVMSKIAESIFIKIGTYMISSKTEN